jgi:hypothetical protein
VYGGFADTRIRAMININRLNKDGQIKCVPKFCTLLLNLDAKFTSGSKNDGNWAIPCPQKRTVE